MHASTQTEELLKRCVEEKNSCVFWAFKFYYSVGPSVNKTQTLNIGEKC